MSETNISKSVLEIGKIKNCTWSEKKSSGLKTFAMIDIINRRLVIKNK